MKPAKAPAPAPVKAPAPAKAALPLPPGGLNKAKNVYSWLPVIQFRTKPLISGTTPPTKLPTFNPTQQSTVSGTVAVFGYPNVDCKYTKFNYGKDTGLVSTFAWKTAKVSFNMFASGKLQKNKEGYLKGVYYGTTSNPSGKNAEKILSVYGINDSAACYIEPLKKQIRITFYQQVKNTKYI
jgi:hypothetical protein